MTEDLIYYNSRSRHALLAAGSLAFVAMGAFIISRQEQVLLGVVTVVFFGACAAVGTWQFFDRRPRLQINEIGILDRTLGIGLVPWVDIEDAYVASINNEHFICLHLENEDAYAGRLSPLKRKLAAANHALGFTHFSINLSGVDLNPEQLLEYILKQAAASRLAR